MTALKRGIKTKLKVMLCWVGLGIIPLFIWFIIFDYIVNVPVRYEAWKDTINSLDCVNNTCLIDDFSYSTPSMYLIIINCLCLLGLICLIRLYLLYHSKRGIET